ncbi:MAG: hypothetical protein IPK26_03335 [Planctomycetes bacterium]|nr:hypothetical protein [Planctomycetota bacterium]
MRRPVVFLVVAILAAALAGGQAWALRWTCDDAYISFRYANHLANGHGLVFNLDPGERPVEGYVHTLWLCLLALGVKLGFTGDALEGWASALGTGSHAVTTLLLALAGWRIGRFAWLPAAAVCWSLLHHAASLAPAGLETALFTCLVTAMAIAVAMARTTWHWAAIGVLGAAMAMTRIDAALFCAATGLWAFAAGWRSRSIWPPIGCAAGFLLPYAPFFAWRYSYYGYLFPNVFYAKSAHDPYPTQGLHYMAEYGKCYPVLFVALLVMVLVPFLPVRRYRDAEPPHPDGTRLAAITASFVLPFLGYVAWVGGDFMFARFALPVTPLLLLALDQFAARLPRLAAIALTVVAGAVTFWRLEPAWIARHPNEHGFTDNRAISLAPALNSGVPWTEAFRAAGHYFGRLWDGLPVRIGIAGSHANLAWRSRVPVAIECATGLTDAYIAHLPLAGRGVIAHEKNYTLFPGYLERRGVHVMFETSWNSGEPIVDTFRDILFPTTPLPTPARLVCWDKALLMEWKRRDPGVLFHDFEQVLDRYLQELPGKDPAEVRRDFAAIQRFYFDHNADPARRQRFEEFLRGR